jgi:hypothetical protein
MTIHSVFPTNMRSRIRYRKSHSAVLKKFKFKNSKNYFFREALRNSNPTSSDLVYFFTSTNIYISPQEQFQFDKKIASMPKYINT